MPLPRVVPMPVLLKNLSSCRLFIVSYIATQYDIGSFLRSFLRGIGVVYLIHAISVWRQWPDLFGPNGIDIAQSSLDNILVFDWISRPSLLMIWISVGLSILLIFGIAPFWALVAQAVIYSSLMVHSSSLFHFQWDILLIEASLIGCLMVSPTWVCLLRTQRVNRPFIFVVPFILLLIRLMYQSGIVKVLHNDVYWRGLSALDIHLYSQPLPHIVSYWIHRWMILFNLGSFFTFCALIVELIVPFFLLSFRYRHLATWVLIGFQVLIMASGNYGYFNILVIALLLPLTRCISPPIQAIKLHWLHRVLCVAFVGVSLLSVAAVFQVHFPSDIRNVFQSFRSFSIVNQYGLFATMTTEQSTFTLYVSHDKNEWEQVSLHYFDDDGFPILKFIAPYQPRIRWQLWFFFIYPFTLPNWQQKLFVGIAQNNHHYASFVSKPLVSTSYDYIKACYQPIRFDLDSEPVTASSVWKLVSPIKCHIFHVTNQSLRMING